MNCCGQGRGRVATNGKAMTAPRRPAPVSGVALYEYTGKTAMTVFGPISGARYRFERPGAKVQIDGRDISSLAGLPNLHRVS